jgi:dTDP-4-dehydrorhamnose reductase
MQVVVTGANGLVGSRCCALLASQAHSVIGLGRGPRRAHGDFAYVTCELSREAEVDAEIAAARPEAIVHTASMTEVDACEKEPEAAFAANVVAAANVARAARRAGAHLVHVSTDYVFDGEHGPYDEEALPNPRGVYAVTKYMGEQAARVLVPGVAIARTAVVFGWPPAGRPNFGAWLVGALQRGQPVRLFEDQLVSPSLADNVAAQLSELAVRKFGGVWNTCGADVVDRVSFARALCARFGFDDRLLVPVRLADVELPSPRPLRSGLVVHKARAQLNAAPLPLDEALARFHQSWKAATAVL